MAIETFGSIIKEEQLKSVDIGIIPNTLVLENLGFFPGYYHADVSNSNMPDSLFLIMTQKESTEKILRLTQIIKKQSGIDFEGTPASICIHNNDLHAIRIRKLTSFEQIGEIQDFYKDLGITFAKAKAIDEIAVIQIKKIFTIEKIDDNLWKDEKRNMFYLEIKDQITWSHFRKIIKQLRNNVQLTAFDAALGVIYASEVHDMIRIYTKTLTIDELKQLQVKFSELIEKSYK
jgi:hypothetical protein